VLLGGWDFATVVTVQSGSALTISETNANNVFGISTDRAQLSGTCSKDQLVNQGSMESKLSGYFNAACFTSPAIIGADGVGTAFGNSGTGIADGPAQANLDLALSKTEIVSWPKEKSSFQFRVEFFNALNHPQFGKRRTGGAEVCVLAASVAPLTLWREKCAPRDLFASQSRDPQPIRHESEV
jgi:hypothetical protein